MPMEHYVLIMQYESPKYLEEKWMRNNWQWARLLRDEKTSNIYLVEYGDRTGTICEQPFNDEEEAKRVYGLLETKAKGEYENATRIRKLGN